MVTRAIGIGVERMVKFRGHGQRHQHQEENQQARSHAPGRAGSGNPRLS